MDHPVYVYIFILFATSSSRSESVDLCDGPSVRNAFQHISSMGSKRVKKGQGGSGAVRWGQVVSSGSCRVIWVIWGSSGVKSGQVGSSQVKLSQVKFVQG